MTDTSPEAVERLDFSLDHYGGQIAPDPDGEYVSYSDFAALAAKLAEAEERLQSATMDGYDMAKEDYRDKLQAAEAALATAREDALREAAALCQGLAEQHTDAALTGLPHNARIREGMEAAFTNARYALLALIERKP